MNTKTKLLLVFLTGVALGATVSHLVTKKRYEEEVQELLDELDEQVNNLFDEYQTPAGKVTSIVRDENGVTATGSLRRDSILAENERLKGEARFINPDDFELSEEYRKRTEKYSERTEEGRPVHLIIEEETFFEDSDFDQTTLSFYRDEPEVILTDENDEVLDDPHGTIGEEAVEMLRGELDIDTLYVRNQKLGVNYEINVVEGLYYADGE